ncbi:MAG: type I-U CRISPR-associated protein Cas5/Cas6 [Deltaproteobacteria bacterium]|nr:type I-U CRISPR-associated protein Cas5/Cas6 [Deltaproteobacteria bacterium]
MVTLEIRFPGGRYHATPWDHHVNEGVVEWPPSPLRIARALLATWHLKARDELSESAVRSLCESLASSLPIYELPEDVTPAHTRHYMPLGGTKTGKIFDAFLRIDASRILVITWPNVELDDPELDALRVLAQRLSYLGRAESWVDARVAERPVERLNAAPVEHLDTGEIVPVLCAYTPAEYERWREAEVDRQLSLELEQQRRKDIAKGKPPEKTRLSKRKREGIKASVPADLFAALHVDTTLLRKQGWSAPPGTRWISYRRPTLAQPRTPKHEANAPSPCAARFAVSGAVLPRLTEALRFGEAVRGALGQSRLRVFHGKDDEGRPLLGHEHAFFLPESHGHEGRITHLSLYAREGLDANAQAAIDKLVSGEIRLEKDATHPMKLTLIGLGERDELGNTGAPLFAEAREWCSLTPFIPTRHLKRKRSGAPKFDAHGRAIGSPEHDVLRLFELAGLPAVEHIEPTEGVKLGGRIVRWLDFYRWRARHGRGARGDSRGFGFRVVFAQAVRGPIAVGFGAHFGLGIFGPESS